MFLIKQNRLNNIVTFKLALFSYSFTVIWDSWSRTSRIRNGNFVSNFY